MPPARTGPAVMVRVSTAAICSRWFEEFSSCFIVGKLWWLEMVNFIEVLEGIGCFGFGDVILLVHVNLERIWH